MIELLIVLIVIGVAAYLVEKHIPMAEYVKSIFRLVVVLFLVLGLLYYFGITDYQFPRR